jgi:hypothetical protein
MQEVEQRRSCCREENAFDAGDLVFPIVFDQLEQLLWRGPDIFVKIHLSGIIEDTDLEGACMQVNSAGMTVLLGIESHRVFSYGLSDLPVYGFDIKLEGKTQ